MSFWKNFKQDILRGGLTETEYRRIHGYVLESNHSNWRRITFWGTLFFVANSIAAILFPAVSGNMWTYIGLAVLFGASTVSLRTMIDQHSSLLTPLIYVLSGVLLFLGIIIGAINTTDNLAVTFMVMMVGVPLVTVGKPYKMDILLTVEAVIFCLIAKNAETGSVREIDIYNCVSFWAVALVINHLISAYRLKSLLWRSQIEQENFTDALTRVKNRTAFIKLRSDTDALIAKEKAEPFGMIVFDVNQLKKVNDAEGHEAGDHYLLANCRKICRVFSHSPVYRTGGDEFFVFLRGQDLEHHMELLSEIDAANREDYSMYPMSEHISLAYGLALYNPKKDRSFSEIYKRADEHMYTVKKTMHGERD